MKHRICLCFGVAVTVLVTLSGCGQSPAASPNASLPPVAPPKITGPLASRITGTGLIKREERAEGLRAGAAAIGRERALAAAEKH